jgi:DUF1009 family protein
VNAATPLAVVCGSGRFPLAVAEAVSATGRAVFLIGIRGAADAAIENYPHGWIGMGRLGRLIRLARSAGAQELVFVGAVPRPSTPRDFIPDLRFLLARWKLTRGGDNRLLNFVARTMTDAGFTVRGVQDVAPNLMLPAGSLGQYAASSYAVAAAELGFQVLDALSPYDVGQSVIIADRRVIAIEAADGTDLMLTRVAELRASGNVRMAEERSVFVKAPKRGQDLRLDTPAVGVETVARAKAAGIAGIAVAAGQVMTPDLAQLIAAADAAGLFMLGVERKT